MGHDHKLKASGRFQLGKRFLLLACSLVVATTPGCNEESTGTKVAVCSGEGLDCKSSSAAGCPTGERGCPCHDGQCYPTPGEGPLICESGYCVPESCTRGSEGCACYGNGSCDPLDGVPMTCVGGVCEATVSREAGGLGGPCGVDSRCGESEHGLLDCVGGVCELAGCPTGSLGCPCEAFGRCDAHDERALRCNADGFCEPGDCVPGSALCACAAGETCNDGLTCERGFCRSPDSVGLSISNPAARACDLLLEESEAPLDEVTFGEAVIGRHLRRGRRVALSFIQREDAAFPGELMRLRFERREPEEAIEPRLVRGVCYDRLGRALDEHGVEIR